MYSKLDGMLLSIIAVYIFINAYSQFKVKLPICLCAVINKWSTSLPFEQNLEPVSEEMCLHIAYTLCCAHSVKYMNISKTKI